MQNYNSHSLKLYSGNDNHYLFLNDGKDTVTGFGSNQQAVHEIRYTDVATGLENQPIMVRGLHCDVGGQTTGVGWKLGDLQSQIESEVSSRQSGDSTFQSNLDDLSSLVNSNKDASDSSINILTNDLVNLSSLVDSNNTSNSSAISSEVSRATASESALELRLAYLEGVIAALVQ